MTNTPKDCLPEGWHKVKIVEINQGPLFATLDLMVIGGKYDGQIFKERLSFEYCGGLRFGEIKFRGISDAVGLMMPPRDAKDILDIPFMAQGHKARLQKIENEQRYKGQRNLSAALERAKRRFKPVTEKEIDQ